MSAADVDRLIKHIDSKFAIFGPGGSESNRWAQTIEEGRQQTADLLAKQQEVLAKQQDLLNKMLADDAVETGRYEQEINETRNFFAHLATEVNEVQTVQTEQTAKLKTLSDAVIPETPEEPPKA